jgi:hypothetical protein
VSPDRPRRTVDYGEAALSVTALFVLVTLFLTGPLVGLDVTTESTPQVGDGDATVDVAFDGEFTLTAGRFGSNASYLRIPDAVVSVDSLEGQPRVLYQVRVPGLGYGETTTRVMTDTRTVRLSQRVQGLAPGARFGGPYTAQVVVRVQSFEGSRTVLRTNRTVEVGR